MKTEEKLPERIYISKKNGNAYPLTKTGDRIDSDSPLALVDLKKYKCVGNNNQFYIYDLIITKYKNLN